MTPEPKISVIILGWNGRKYVRDCLASVLDQDFEGTYEVLFVDNGSTDGTANEAESFAGVTVHRLDKNYGFCIGNNKGFERSRGELVVFLNQDVIVHRGWLRELAAAVESSAEIKAAHASIVHPWNPEFAERRREGRLGAAYWPELSRLGFVEYRTVSDESPVRDSLFISGASAIIKRDVLEEVGGYVFDPDMFLYGEDLDLALRIRSAGYRTVIATRAVVYHFHTLQDEISLPGLIKVTRIIRNRLLALWKCSTWPEFAVLAVVTLAGAPFNSGQFRLPPWKRGAYFLALIPPSVLAVFASVIAMPRFASRRREVLGRRRRRAWWLPRALLVDRGSLDRDRRIPTPEASRRDGAESAGAKPG
jgi:GT2 family glycosyltransferase